MYFESQGTATCSLKQGSGGAGQWKMSAYIIDICSFSCHIIKKQIRRRKINTRIPDCPPNPNYMIKNTDCFKTKYSKYILKSIT